MLSNYTNYIFKTTILLIIILVIFIIFYHYIYNINTFTGSGMTDTTDINHVKEIYDRLNLYIDKIYNDNTNTITSNHYNNLYNQTQINSLINNKLENVESIFEDYYNNL